MELQIQPFRPHRAAMNNPAHRHSLVAQAPSQTERGRRQGLWQKRRSQELFLNWQTHR